MVRSGSFTVAAVALTIYSLFRSRRRTLTQTQGGGDVAVFTGQNFDGARFNRQCWIGAKFVDCTFRGATFEESDLSYAVFERCDLYRTNLSGACLYAARLIDCDATKAIFKGAFLAGVRVESIDITHAEFDQSLALGRVRKPTSASPGVPKGCLEVDLGAPSHAVRFVEQNYQGIYRRGFDRVVVFSDDPSRERWRRHRRREEVAKIIKIITLENGYYERALKYYHLERRHRRKAIPWLSLRAPARVLDFLVGELFWGYGTSIVRPVLCYVLATLSVAGILIGLNVTALPGGIKSAQTGIDAQLSEYADVAYYLATVAVGNNAFTAYGLGAAIFLAHTFLSLVLLSLLFASTARRLANL